MNEVSVKYYRTGLDFDMSRGFYSGKEKLRSHMTDGDVSRNPAASSEEIVALHRPVC